MKPTLKLCSSHSVAGISRTPGLVTSLELVPPLVQSKGDHSGEFDGRCKTKHTQREGLYVLRIRCRGVGHSPCPLSLPILNKRDKIDPPPIVSIIHTVTTGTMLNRNGSNFRTINDRVTVLKVMREFIPKIIHQTHTGSWSLVNQRALSLRLDII